MEVVKITRKVYKCLNVTDKPFTKFSKFREIRERLGMKVQRCCFNCNHKFTDDEDMYLAIIQNQAAYGLRWIINGMSWRVNRDNKNDNTVTHWMPIPKFEPKK